MFIPRNVGSAFRRAVAAAVFHSRPILVQLVVTRRCNLACGYCFEFNAVSPHVDTGLMLERIDRAADLGAIVLTLTGGEPLLHPDLELLVSRADNRGMICTVLTNGTELTQQRIERLNQAGLAFLQISIDNIEPNGYSQKSWANLREPVKLLREHARFGVNVNAVLGSCEPDTLRALAAEVRAAGFYMTVGVMHGKDGGFMRTLAGEEYASLWEEIKHASSWTLFHRAGENWEPRLIREGAAPFKCRAGGRYLYVDEAGVVSYCSQQRSQPGINLLDMGPRQLAQAFKKTKACSVSCAVGCARRASAFDVLWPQSE
jgi:MoaA/NifB/PqqE/SkfB family radical SAM enzyme